MANIYIPIQNLSINTDQRIDLTEAALYPISLAGNNMKRIFKNFPYVLEVTPKENEQNRSCFKRSLTIFKLYRNRMIFSCCYLFNNNMIDKLPHFQNPYTYKPSGDPVYYLTQSEVPNFLEFWTKFNDIEVGDFSVSRYLQADYRPFWEDNIVDFVESLEYLMVPDSKSGLIRFKFWKRGSVIFDSRFDNAANRLKYFYDLRSAIVHGNKKQKNRLIKGKRWHDLSNEIKEINRQMIIHFYDKNLISNFNLRTKYNKEITNSNLNIRKKIDNFITCFKNI